MPAFTFEKISPPNSRGPTQSTANNNDNNDKKQRRLLVQILDHFAEARVKKVLRRERGVPARKPSNP
jgi:hypothetical protein